MIMKKSGVILGLLVMSILLAGTISFVSLVSAESNETEANNETETDEPETEECAASISINFNQDVYSKGDLFEMTIEVFDSYGSHLPNYAFYTTMYDDRWHTPGLQETDADGYFRYTVTVDKPAGGVTKVKFKVYTKESGSCGAVEDIGEIEVIYEEEEGDAGTEPGPEPEPAPTVCAAKIEIKFDKTGYAPGDSFNVEVGVFDSQGNPIPNYEFYVRMYDTMWHSPDLQKTGSDGYFRHTGETPEKAIQGVTKGIFNAYTKELGSCGKVEDTIELNLEGSEESEPVPCGIGTCIPEEEEEPVDIPDEKVFYKCSGCELGDKCYPMGYRKAGQFCSENSEFIGQSKAGICDNNFECESNVCISGECVEEGLMRRIIKWFRKLFGEEDEDEEPGDKICRKLLIEKNIEGHEYFVTEYGKREEQQMGLFSEDGEQIGIVKCCVAGYKFPDGTEGVAGIVCPFDNRKDVENSVQGLLNNGDIVLGEYKGQKIYRRLDKPEEVPEIIVWTSKNYLIASGRGPGEGQISEPVADAYLKNYPSDL